jgi:hypothetical protein
MISASSHRPLLLCKSALHVHTVSLLTVTCTYSTADLPWDRKAFKIGRDDIRGEFILVFFVLSLYLDRTERERDR